jgi:chorismate dehydratase
MYRISLVSYSNTLPIKEALHNSDFIKNNSVLQERNPAMCAADLFDGNADIALVPIGAFPLPEGFKVVGDFCLAAYNKVESVLLLSQCPMSEIKTILLDYQSRSSVKYVRILAEKYWNLKCDFVDANESFEFQISGNTAAVIIGDRALNLRNSFHYKYDLAAEWFKFTGKPAVFAVWVANNNVDSEFISQFNSVLKVGVDSRVVTAQKYKHLYQGFDLQDYLTNCLDYQMDSDKLQSIELFGRYCREL